MGGPVPVPDAGGSVGVALPDPRPTDRGGDHRGGTRPTAHASARPVRRGTLAGSAGITGHTARAAGTPRANAATAVHPQGPGVGSGSRTLPDGVCGESWRRGSADGRVALHAARFRALEGTRHR